MPPESDSNGQTSAQDQLRTLYEGAESATTKAFEQAVSTPSFGALLARSAENVAAISRIGADTADLVLRNLRLAGRSDITRLARQLHRTEDKLERVLQEIEQLRDEIAAAQGSAANGRGETPNGQGSNRSGSGETEGASSPRGGSGGSSGRSRTT